MREIRLKVPDNEYGFFVEMLKRFPNTKVEEDFPDTMMVSEEQQQMIQQIDEKTKSEDYKDWSKVRNELIKKHGL